MPKLDSYQTPLPILHLLYQPAVLCNDLPLVDSVSTSKLWVEKNTVVNPNKQNVYLLNAF